MRPRRVLADDLLGLHDGSVGERDLSAALQHAEVRARTCTPSRVRARLIEVPGAIVLAQLETERASAVGRRRSR